MTVMESLCGPGKEILLVAVMLLVLLHAYLLMAFSRLGRKGFFAVLEGIQFLLLFAGFFLMLDGIFHYGDPSKPRTWPFFTRAFCSLPLVPVLIFLLFSAAWFLYGNYRARRFRREHLTPGAIKETIDLLPAGVAFAEEDGDVVLSNLCMNRLSENLTGKNLIKLTPLMELAEKKDTEEDALPAVVNGETGAWQFSTGTITEMGKKYLQLTATDISERAAINAELKGKNERLRQIRARLEIYNRTAEQLIISKELLNARMQVHNETGHVLLASRRFMDQPASVDEKALLDTLKVTNSSLLREYEEDDTQRDPLGEAIEMAKAIGVDVSFKGIIPADGKPRAILAAALNECATNTRKHAGGDRVTVHTEKDEEMIRFTISSNGTVTGKEISESGGLGTLRTLVEEAGGEMQIEAVPEFTLKISMSEKKEEG